MFREDRHSILTSASSHRSTRVSSSHLRLSAPSGLLPLGFPTKILNTFLPSRYTLCNTMLYDSYRLAIVTEIFSFSWFHSATPCKCWDSTYIRPQSLHFTYLLSSTGVHLPFYLSTLYNFNCLNVVKQTIRKYINK
jgi:hypothetical protein